MKVEFWKESLLAIILMSLGPLMCLIFIIISALGLLGNADIKSAIIILTFALLLSVLPYFKKGLFYKVILSDTGIALKHGKKQVVYIEWFEITDFEIILKYRGGRRLKFVAGDKIIDIYLSSQKLYDTIMEICPNLNIIIQIKDSPYLDMYYKTWLNKQQKNKQK